MRSDLIGRRTVHSRADAPRRRRSDGRQVGEPQACNTKCNKKNASNAKRRSQYKLRPLVFKAHCDGCAGGPRSRTGKGNFGLREEDRPTVSCARRRVQDRIICPAHNPRPHYDNGLGLWLVILPVHFVVIPAPVVHGVLLDTTGADRPNGLDTKMLACDWCG